MKKEVIQLIKKEFHLHDPSPSEIPNFLNEKYLIGDNQKYMKMYNWMSRVYDMVERVGGKLIYGNQVNQMRQIMMHKLEWKNNISVLNLSIGTGKDLEFIPKNIDKDSLNIVGADISLGMLKKCRKKYKNKLNLTLVNCCAEDLPFRDNSFDIVFHVGGINFFTDKKKSAEEMIRVAKPGTKLLIADETNDLIEKHYRKSALSKKYFKDAGMDLTSIESLLPDTERATEILWNGKFYCVTFRKY